MESTSHSVMMYPPGNQSLHYLSKLKNIIAATNYMGLYGITLKTATGNTIIDVDGNHYLDCLTGASVNIIGYDYKQPAYEYLEQSLKIQHTCFTYSPHPKVIEFSELLLSITPGGEDRRVILGLSGSDANDAAIKVIRSKRPQKKILHFVNSYHGTTGFSQQVSHFKDFNDNLYSESNEYIGLRYPKNQNQEKDTLATIEKLFISHEIGAVILEPIQGDAGIFVLSDFFIKSLYDLTRQYNVIFSVDEVQSGMGRTGKWWAIDHFNIVPDIMVVGKSLGGGYAPLSAAIIKHDLLDEMVPGQHVLTLAGHPPTCAASMAVIHHILKQNLIESAIMKGEAILEHLTWQLQKYPFIKEIRGKGLMIGIELDVSKDELITKKMAFRCVELGLYVGYYGEANNVIRIQPPLTISNHEVSFLLSTIEQVCLEYNEGKFPDRINQKVKSFSIGL
ncbi:aspartate aminotransferase family protein [Flammeovirga sp. EKP202]|uniref:aspartate aminotransferase family protein n=1 Tax=Flammeovirga sp. EKP202 TaxID=2770592 RepID=UPI00165EBFB6|nr:aminotransferase class III-fold pyridoxal phosphate-dependent enzyme [Flammeovirga sp. EKP202]MBD0403762.1 aminotransferase class III-fold pyridoxal phosphate-dependent enzyme [Flammeovirga sp. EKP202]